MAGSGQFCTIFCFLLSGDDRPACSVGTRMGFDSKSPGIWYFFVCWLIQVAVRRLRKEYEEIQSGRDSNDESRTAIDVFPLEVLMPWQVP